MCRVLVVLVAIACFVQVSPKPVRKTVNFHMFVLQPQSGSPDRTILATNEVSRFGPLLEYIVQRIQGMMSVRLPPEAVPEDDNLFKITHVDTAENEVDGIQESKMPGVVVRPSVTKPGTYEVEIDMVVDDGQPTKIN